MTWTQDLILAIRPGAYKGNNNVCQTAKDSSGVQGAEHANMTTTVSMRVMPSEGSNKSS
jgi:hypothetical protein